MVFVMRLCILLLVFVPIVHALKSNDKVIGSLSFMPTCGVNQGVETENSSSRVYLQLSVGQTFKGLAGPIVNGTQFNSGAANLESDTTRSIPGPLNALSWTYPFPGTQLEFYRDESSPLPYAIIKARSPLTFMGNVCHLDQSFETTAFQVIVYHSVPLEKGIWATENSFARLTLQ